MPAHVSEMTWSRGGYSNGQWPRESAQRRTARTSRSPVRRPYHGGHAQLLGTRARARRVRWKPRQGTRCLGRRRRRLQQRRRRQRRQPVRADRPQLHGPARVPDGQPHHPDGSRRTRATACSRPTASSTSCSQHGVHVYWMIDPGKTWHAAACNAAGDPCAWDCGVEGSGVKCAYPTASPDFTRDHERDLGRHRDGARAARRSARTRLSRRSVRDRRRRSRRGARDHRRRGTIRRSGPRTRGRCAPCSTSSPCTRRPRRSPATSRATMIAAPTIAVFADGNEDIATGYLRAAGIPQSNGAEFPTRSAARATAARHGEPRHADRGGDHGRPRHVRGAEPRSPERRAVQARRHAGVLPDHVDALGRQRAREGQVRRRQLPGDPGAVHRPAVHVQRPRGRRRGPRSSSQYSTHFFAECQAVNAYENTVPNPAWPFLDDAGRDGHFLTTTGTPPLCPARHRAPNADYQCVPNACDGRRAACRSRRRGQNLPGYEVATQPASEHGQGAAPRRAVQPARRRVRHDRRQRARLQPQHVPRHDVQEQPPGHAAHRRERPGRSGPVDERLPRRLRRHHPQGADRRPARPSAAARSAISAATSTRRPCRSPRARRARARACS